MPLTVSGPRRRPPSPCFRVGRMLLAIPSIVVQRRRGRPHHGGDWLSHRSTVVRNSHVPCFFWCMYLATMGPKTKSKALRSTNSSATSNTGRVQRMCTITANKPEFISVNKRSRRPVLPEMLDDLVSEILVRLPVKSLLRFKSVCRTWHATISSRSFISMHLKRSVSSHQRHPRFLLTPHFLAEGSSNISLYRWQKSQGNASLAHTLNFFEGKSVQVYRLGHCNGLVLVPTDTKMYVLNPSTRELLTLPESIRSVIQPSSICRSIVGFGLDSFTNKYKVVRFFNYLPNLVRMGMEICTISGTGRAWRRSDVDPPYPVSSWQTATFFQGSLFWILDKPDFIQSPESRLLRFCLKEEVFSLTHPPCPDLDHDDFVLNELDGKLCLAQFESAQRTVIWMTSDAVNPQWYRRYILNIKPSLTMAISPGELLLVDVHRVFQYDFQSQKTENVAHLDCLNYDGPGSSTINNARQNSMYIGVLPCIESLVPIAIAR